MVVTRGGRTAAVQSYNAVGHQLQNIMTRALFKKRELLIENTIRTNERKFKSRKTELKKRKKNKIKKQSKRANEITEEK